MIVTVKTGRARRQRLVRCDQCSRHGPAGWLRPDVYEVGWRFFKQGTQRYDRCQECITVDKPKPGERWEEVGKRKALCLEVLDVTDTEVSLRRRMQPPMVPPLAEFLAGWRRVVLP